jgi:hypothetical protein
MAAVAGLNLPSYYDLEADDGEIFMCLSLDGLQAICKELKISAREIFTGEPRVARFNAISFDALAKRVSQYLQEHKMPLETFEDMVGWSLVGEFLQNPQSANGWNVDCLQDICRPLNVDWLDALPC